MRCAVKFDIRQDEPVVSISVITYNHAPYIHECLDGLLRQQTQFPYEICIGEDESSDGTREICIEYAEKNPDKIKLTLRSQSEPGRDTYMAQGNYNYVQTTRQCRGKYLAVCEGDDVWLDPLKLQKQYEIMKADPSISLVHSDYDRLDILSGSITSFVHKTNGHSHEVKPDKSAFMCDVMQVKYPIATCTAFMRTQTVLDIFDNHMELFKELPMGDIPTWCELISHGSFAYMDESLALYRVLEESASNTQSPWKKYQFVNRASNLGLMLSRRYPLPLEFIRRNKVKNCNRYALLSGDRTEIDQLHADPQFKFPVMETMIYHVCRIPVLRKFAQYLFLRRYAKNNRLSHLGNGTDGWERLSFASRLK
jgi:glycosyltransferase involved in cell wall biosynthesis